MYFEMINTDIKIVRYLGELGLIQGLKEFNCDSLEEISQYVKEVISLKMTKKIISEKKTLQEINKSKDNLIENREKNWTTKKSVNNKNI